MNINHPELPPRGGHLVQRRAVAQEVVVVARSIEASSNFKGIVLVLILSSASDQNVGE